MYKSFVKFCFIAASAVALIGQPTAATAAPLNAYEVIGDGLIPEIFSGSTDLWRIRSLVPGAPQVSTDAALIKSENNVSDSFGVFNGRDVSYTHDLNWLTPPASSYTNATLTIFAFGPLGADDNVYVSHDLDFSLGDLGDLGFLGGSFGDGLITATLNEGGLLNVHINKNEGAGFFGSMNNFTVLASKLYVEYEPLETGGDPVPEPTMLLLLGAGLMGGAVRLRRRK